MLVHQFINDLLKREKRSAIINVGSLAGYAPTGFQGCYSGTQRMLKFFTYGLHDNYNNKIDVLGLNPGTLKTKESQETSCYCITTPDVTVRNGLRDLGYEIETTGFYAHTIKGGLISIFSRYATPIFDAVSKNCMEKKALEQFRKDHLAKKQS